MTRWLKSVALIPFLILALPVALVANLFSKGKKTSPAELAAHLRRLADGREEERDWDMLENVRLRDPRLEAIRQRANATAWPPKPADLAMLRCLADEAEACAPRT